jgi:hypothetical protein
MRRIADLQAGLTPASTAEVRQRLQLTKKRDSTT